MNVAEHTGQTEDTAAASSGSEVAVPDRMAAAAVLELQGIHKSYPGIKVLTEVTLSVKPGEVVAVIGENGAGKTTLLRLAAGLELPDAGEVLIDRAPIYAGVGNSAKRVQMARKHGVSMAYQDTSLVPDLTVTSNLLLGLPPGCSWPKPGDRDNWAAERIRQFTTLPIDPRAQVVNLTPEQRQIVEIVKALISEPRILLLDEPTAALSADQVEHVLRLVAKLRDRGVAIIYVSHRLREVLGIADRIIVLRDGATVVEEESAEGTKPDEEQLVAAMVGRPVSLAFPEKALQSQGGGIVISADFVFNTTGHAVFEARAGEILGFAGIAGNGQREALRALAGLEKFTGKVRVRGKAVKSDDPVSAKQLGVYFLSDDRAGEALFSLYSVCRNVCMLSLNRLVGIGGLIRPSAERNLAKQRVAEFGIRGTGIDQPVRLLSGGNQQKTALARLPGDAVHVLLISEPTQGVDANSRLEIYRMLRDLANRGAAIIVQSSDQLELAGLCDRVLVWDRGRIVRELQGENLTGEAIVAAATQSLARRQTLVNEVASPLHAIKNLLASDIGPSVVIAFLFLALGIAGALGSPYFLSMYNFSDILTLSMAMGVVSAAAFFVIMIGGLDLSVGPLMGVTIVLASYLVTKETGLAGGVLGTVAMLAVGVVIGVFHFLLAQRLHIPSLAVTLATYTMLQGIALLLRPVPAGEISSTFTGLFNWPIPFLEGIPVLFFVILALVILGERALIMSRPGHAIRAVGSDAIRAERNGINPETTILAAYVLCSLLAVVAGFFLAGRVGIGDARSGLNFSLWSITAVVIGGTSLAGGRGSLLGTFLGAILLVGIINLTIFLNFDTAMTLTVTGFMMLMCVSLYSVVRRRD